MILTVWNPISLAVEFTVLWILLNLGKNILNILTLIYSLILSCTKSVIIRLTGFQFLCLHYWPHASFFVAWSKPIILVLSLLSIFAHLILSILVLFNCFLHFADLVAHLEPSQMSEMELFAKIVNSLKTLIVLGNGFIYDVWLSSEFASEFAKSVIWLL